MKLWASVWRTGLVVGIAATVRAGDVGLIKVKGAIGTGTASYIARAIEVSGARQDSCLIVQLDTPGGTLSATKDIVQSFYASKVPIVVYVAPAGAWAGSAGCFITMAADVAAMAPSTSIGAAHPVSIGPGGAEKMDDVMKEKTENFYGSYIKSIAEKRGRNAEWAVSSVVKSQSVSATNALELNVVDMVVKDVPELLTELDGRDLNGKAMKTAHANVREILMTRGEHVLQLLSQPEVMMIVMLAAMYGLIAELSNPGAVLPGVVGAIALILLLYMTAILPVNMAGLALIGLAVVLFIVDVYAPTHGVLTFGGIAAFFMGALMLFNRADPGLHLSLAYIIPATFITAAFFTLVVGAGLRAQLLPAKTGKEAMIGRTAPVLARTDNRSGKVFIEGEYWNAVSESPIEAGQTAEIVGIEGLTLKVKPRRT
jgi:membrane-bound serine protease (ClpP class)